MDTQQLKRVMLSDNALKLRYGGVLPADYLPETVPSRPISYIVNVDPSSKPGSHWTAFDFSADGSAYFFDSYGNAPEQYDEHFKHFLDNNSCRWMYNRIHLQGPLSSVCGQYCLYFLLKRARNVPLNKIVSVFSANAQNNDQMVNDFIRSHFNVNSRVYDSEFIVKQIARALYN